MVEVTNDSEESNPQLKTENNEDDGDIVPDDDDDDDDDDLFGTGDSPVAEPPSEIPAKTQNASEEDKKVQLKSESDTSTMPLKTEDAGPCPDPGPGPDSGRDGSGSKTGPASIPRKEAIPRKNEQPEAFSATSAPAAGPGLSASEFGLPEGVTIPSSVHEGLLQGKLLDSLKGLPIQLINDALTEYDDAVQIKGSAIRNHGAYLYGVIKRYVNVQTRASRGEGDGILPMGQDLTPAVQERLEQLVQSRFCTQEEMNDKVKSKIRMLSEKDALVAIDELANVERSQIRNFGSYFMGILNRYMRGQAGPGHPPQKDNRQNDHHHHNHNHNHHHHNNNSHHNNNNHHNNNHRGRYGDRRRDDRDGDFRRGRDRFHRNDNNYDSYRRERSRDRHDHDSRNDHYRRESDRDHRYDPRQQRQQQQFPGQPNRGVVVPPPPRNPGMPAYGQQQNFMPQNQQVYQQQHTQPGQKQQFVSQMNSPPSNRSGMPLVQQNMQQPIPSHHQQNVMNRQPMSAQQPQQHYVGNQQQPLVMHQHQQQPQHQHQSVINQQQQHFVANQQQPQQPPINSQQQPFMGNQQQPQQGQTAQGSYPQTPAAAWQQPQTQVPPQPQGQVPVDILGLADKAASAVQALASQNKLQMPNTTPPYGSSATHSSPPVPPAGPPYSNVPASMGAPPPAPPPMSYPGPHNGQASHMHYSNSNHQMNQRGPAQPAAGAAAAFRKRTATAKIEELPVMVQYAVQNLQATGQVDGPLDEGMLGMIKDLPENLALGSLQKFSTIDKNTVRNKTAYLAGVLRRELERINRR